MLKLIALFRGINVGGKNKLSMKALTEILEEKGYRDVKTYIQSGNVLFSTSESKVLSEEISKEIKRTHGFEPEIILLKIEDLQKAIDANPFPTDSPKFLHLYFHSDVPKQPDLEGLNQIKAPSERFQLIGKVFYFFSSEGMGRSKLTAQVEKRMGVKATARNWNTVTKLLEMASEED